MKGKILIIDDETSVRELFTGVFTDEDYEVVATEDGNLALDILKRDNIDVIFLDLKLFGMKSKKWANVMTVSTTECTIKSVSVTTVIGTKMNVWANVEVVADVIAN